MIAGQRNVKTAIINKPKARNAAASSGFPQFVYNPNSPIFAFLKKIKIPPHVNHTINQG